MGGPRRAYGSLPAAWLGGGRRDRRGRSSLGALVELDFALLLRLHFSISFISLCR